MSIQEIIGSKCADCSNKTFPKRKFCPACRSTNLKDWLVPSEGIIYSYTIVNFPIEKYEDSPYYVGLVSTEGVNKPLITAKITFQNESKLQIGQKVHISVNKNFGPYNRNILVASIDE